MMSIPVGSLFHHPAKLVTGAIAVAALAVASHAQDSKDTPYPKPPTLPNPYRLVADWPTLPASMKGPNGRKWGEVIRVHLAPDGNIWVFQRCFSDKPAGDATCLNRGDANPPILEFNPAGQLLRSFGIGLFGHPHGFTVDKDGNIWTTDTNDAETILGMPAKNAQGVTMGQEVLKISPTGKVLMTIGTEGDFREPHDIYVGGSKGYVYVADRQNHRIQVFDQDGNYIAAWRQFGQPSSVYVDQHDNIFVGAEYAGAQASSRDASATEPKTNVNNRAIVIGNAITDELKYLIPDSGDLSKMTDTGTSASGIAEDDEGNIYAADVGENNLRKYVRVQ